VGEAGREPLDEVREVSQEEGGEMFDAVCRRELGMPGPEFFRRWDAGEYRDVDLDSVDGLLEVVMMIPFAREERVSLQPGDRVKWCPEPGDEPDHLAMRGTVCAPTEEELAYVATWSPTARAAVHGHVIIVWDHEERWEGVWADPADLVKVGHISEAEDRE
jgi:hypothetical protein